MGVHASEDKLGTCGRHLVMAQTYSAPQIDCLNISERELCYFPIADFVLGHSVCYLRFGRSYSEMGEHQGTLFFFLNNCDYMDLISIIHIMQAIRITLHPIDEEVEQITSSMLTTETAWPPLGSFMCATVIHPFSWYSWMASSQL